MAGTDPGHVIIAPGNSSRHVFHLPDPEDPERPECHLERQRAACFIAKDPSLVPDHWELCKRCDPDYERDVRHEGEQMSTRLNQLNADDVSRESAGGDA